MRCRSLSNIVCCYCTMVHFYAVRIVMGYQIGSGDIPHSERIDRWYAPHSVSCIKTTVYNAETLLYCPTSKRLKLKPRMFTLTNDADTLTTGWSDTLLWLPHYLAKFGTLHRPFSFSTTSVSLRTNISWSTQYYRNKTAYSIITKYITLNLFQYLQNIVDQFWNR